MTVKDGKATVTLKATIDFLTPGLQTPQGILFSLNVVSELPGDEMPSQGNGCGCMTARIPLACPALQMPCSICTFAFTASSKR